MNRLKIVAAVLVLGMSVATGEVSAQTGGCEGSASAATSESTTTPSSCDVSKDEFKDSLKWTLKISCKDRCGKVWSELAPSAGSADGACTAFPKNLCHPQWYRYNHESGMYAESSAWSMYVFNGCKQGTLNTTAGNCPCAPPCWTPDDRPDPDPHPCSTTPDTKSTVLGLAGRTSAELTTLPSGFFTERRETVGNVKFIMEDWAVVRVAPESDRVRLLGLEGSSSALLAPRAAAVSARRASRSSGDPGQIALVVEAPVHPDNSRMIPTPGVELRAAALPYLGERITAAVRIDVGADREIREVKVLYGTGSLPAGIDLAQHLRDNLQLQYQSAKQHRVIVYGIVDVEAGKVLLRENEVILPLCCCNPICK